MSNQSNQTDVCAQCESNARWNELGGYADLAQECRAYCRRGHQLAPEVLGALAARDRVNDVADAWEKWQRARGTDPISVEVARAGLEIAVSDLLREAGDAPMQPIEQVSNQANLSAITAETITDDDIREAIRWLETDVGILEAALKIKTGKLVEMMRKGAADVINARCRDEVMAERARESV